MTDLLRTALTQSAIDCGCLPEDFLRHREHRRPLPSPSAGPEISGAAISV